MNARDATSVYRQAAAQGATPVGHVVLLYERLIKDIHSALAALSANDIEERSLQVNHAFLILQQLQGTLNFEAGGEVARQLDQFYELVRAKLLEAQIKQSREIMLQQVQVLSQVRDCWVEVEKQEGRSQTSSPSRAQLQPPQSAGEEGSVVAWNA